MKINDKIVYDIAIIGGGFSGMCCAYILAKEGYKEGKFEIIEARISRCVRVHH